MAYSRNLSEKLQPTVAGLGYELLGIETESGGQGTLLRCFIDSPAGITVDDCERVSRQLGDLIEAEQLLNQAYTLEVSSPGVDRPLFTLQQIGQQQGETVEIRLKQLFEGRRKIVGELIGVEEELIKLADMANEYDIPYRMVDKAKVVYQWNS